MAVGKCGGRAILNLGEAGIGNSGIGLGLFLLLGLDGLSIGWLIDRL